VWPCAWPRVAPHPHTLRPDQGSQYETVAPPFSKCPRQESNLRTKVRNLLLYPLSYGGSSIGSVPASIPDSGHFWTNPCKSHESRKSIGLGTRLVVRRKGAWLSGIEGSSEGRATVGATVAGSAVPTTRRNQGCRRRGRELDVVSVGVE
jgi:hypothetical protein